MKNRWIAGALLGALASGTVHAQQTVRTGTPDEVGMSEAVLRSGITLFDVGSQLRLRFSSR